MKNSKILKIKAERAKQQKLIAQQRHTEEIKALSELKDSFDSLYELINGQEPVDLSKLSDQIKDLSEVIDIKEQVQSIHDAVKGIKFESKELDLKPIVKAIEKNKPEKVDFGKLEKAIIEIQERVQEQVVEESQDPEDYKPFRRVIKVGNRLVYDDRPTPGNRGGGGSSGGSSGGLTDAELRATPVSVTDTNPPQTDALTDTELRATPVPVSATDLDIRNLNATDDIVQARQTTHDNLNLNANIQVGNSDATASNPVPIGTRTLNTAFSDTFGNTAPIPTNSAGTAFVVPSYGMVYDGSSQWFRMRGSIADGLLMDLGTNNDVTPSASATVGAGLSHFRNAAVSNTAVAIKASAGKLHGYNLYNPNASLVYVHFYNVAAASVTVGTTTPIRSVALPSTANGTIAVEREFSLGIAFSTAISVACSTTATGGTAPGTAVVVNAEYI